MSSCTPNIATNRKQARKPRLWKFPGVTTTRSFQESATDDEETLQRGSMRPRVLENMFCCNSEDDDNGAPTVEKSGKSLPNSQLGQSLRENSFNTTAIRKKLPGFVNEGYPPSGYLWIWTGLLRRWHRNYFQLETPGVLTHSRRVGSQMRGALCLRDARVVASHGHSRQFCIVTPSGVVYLRSLRKDQRGPWISNIRSSIEKYTQCIQQAQKAQSSMSKMGYAVEPEEEQVAKRVKDRVNERMSELLPHQAALKWQMNQLTRKLNSVKEILSGGEGSGNEGGNRSRRGAMSPTENGGLRRVSPRQSNLSALREMPQQMVRHKSLTSELPIVVKPKSPKAPSDRRQGESKTSMDDSTLRKGSSVDVNGLRDRAKMRKCQTPRPVDSRRWSSPRTTTTTRNSGCYPREENSVRSNSATTPRRRSMDSPFQAATAQETTTKSLNDSNAWRSYQNFVEAAQRTIQKEVQISIELEMENAALKRLLGARRSEEAVERNLEVETYSALTSRSYSTAESDFDSSLLEHSEEEPEAESKGRRPLGDNEELINALEVVRRAEYVTRNSSNSDALVVNIDSAVLPKEYEDGDDEDSLLEDGSDLLGLMEPRTRLPAPRPIQRGFSVWSILKNAIGRDLTRITMPATINEPLSALQRLVEEFEYASFLNMAAICQHSYERLLYITVFVLSSYNAALLRDSKPFNPLLGETFEWSNDQFRFIGEQVSHHPPISCINVQGFDASSEESLYEVHGELELRSKFWGTTLNVLPAGRMELNLATTNERYVWNKACISIHNLVLGQLWLDFHGEIQIQNVTTGDYAKIRLAKARGYPLDRGNLEGKIFNAQHREVYSIDGNFTKAIYARKYPQNSRDEIFRAKELPPHAVDQYNMTDFAVGLNDIRAFDVGDLPKTDSRFRPDVRQLELGAFVDATREKLRLEDKQRQTRKARKETGQKYIPKWFSLRRSDMTDVAKAVEHDHPSIWKFRNDYWQRKAARSWVGCPDIY